MSSDERKWRRAAAVGLSALVLIAASLWILNGTALPLELARRAAGLVSAETGWSVEIGRARFVGPTRLLIEDVEIGGPRGAHGSSPRAYVAFNPISLLGIGKPDSGLGRVDLVGPHIVVPSELLRAWRQGESEARAERAVGLGAAGSGGPGQAARSDRHDVVRGTLEERGESGTAGLWRAEGEFVVQVGGPARLKARRSRFSSAPET